MITTAQTIAGNKTFSSTVTGSAFSVTSGGINMNYSILRLRQNFDNNHGLLYNSVIDGMELRGGSGFRWMTGLAGANERMRLDGSGNLTVSGNITTTGTINGTLANNSVDSAQVTEARCDLQIWQWSIQQPACLSLQWAAAIAWD